ASAIAHIRLTNTRRVPHQPPETAAFTRGARPKATANPACHQLSGCACKLAGRSLLVDELANQMPALLRESEPAAANGSQRLAGQFYIESLQRGDFPGLIDRAGSAERVILPAPGEVVPIAQGSLQSAAKNAGRFDSDRGGRFR